MMHLNLHTETMIEALVRIRAPLFIVLVGIPGSGKTTLARELSLHLEPIVICSTDSLDPRTKPGQGKMVRLDHWVNRAVMTGISVIIDQTNMEQINRVQRLKQAPVWYTKVCIDLSGTELDKCIAMVEERHKQGGRYVPEHVTRELYAKYESPKFSEGFEMIIDVIT